MEIKTYKTKRVKEKKIIKDAEEEEEWERVKRNLVFPLSYGPTCSECRSNGNLICVYRCNSYRAVNTLHLGYSRTGSDF